MTSAINLAISTQQKYHNFFNIRKIYSLEVQKLGEVLLKRIEILILLSRKMSSTEQKSQTETSSKSKRTGNRAPLQTTVGIVENETAIAEEGAYA